jgi:hypothetical protein
MTADVLASPALPLLVNLERRGCRFRIDGPHICIHSRRGLTAADRAALQANYEDAIALVRLATDAAVHARRDVFRQQLETAHPPTVPAFLFRPDVPYAQGTCFSCGETLSAVRFGRCWRCSLAWRLACHLSIPVNASDDARVVERT